jgi:O-antigen ligase
MIWLVIKERKNLELDIQLKLAAIILIESVIWVPLAVNNYFAFNDTLNLMLYFGSVLLSVRLLCNTEEMTQKFIRHWVFIMAVLAVIVISRGGVGPGSFVEDENDVCAVLVAGIPFAFWARKHVAKTTTQRMLFLACALIIILAAAYTRSRGGFLGLIASLGVTWWYTRNRIRTLLIAAVSVVVLGSAAMTVMPKGYFAEMLTMEDPNDSTKLDRFKHWWTAWYMFKDNPVFGVGPGNYPWHHENYVIYTKYYNPNGRMGAGRQSHSLYFTLLPELGTVGTAAYLGMLLFAFRRLNYIHSRTSGRAAKTNTPISPAIADLAGATLASIAGILVAGTFISIFWYETSWQWLMMYWAVDNVYQKSLAQT